MKKLNNKGITLVEMLVALSITSIVMVAIFTFISVGTSNFNSSKKEVAVQTEAQTVMNQLSDLIIDADRGVLVYGSYGTTYDKALVIYNKDKIHMIFYHAGNKKLYYAKSDRIASSFIGTIAEIQDYVNSNNVIDDKYLMAQYVSSFEAEENIYDGTGAVTGNDVTVNLEITYEERSCPMYSKVALRNKPIPNP